MRKLNPTEKTYTEAKLSNAFFALSPVLVILYFVQGVSIVFHCQKKKEKKEAPLAMNCMFWRKFLILTQLKHYESFCGVIIFFTF